MITTGTSASGLLSLLAAANGESPALQAGQRLQATVTKVDTDGTATLRVGAQTIQARGPVSLAPGQNVQLQVTEVRGQLVLQLVQAARPEQAVLDGIRAALPRQAGLGPLLANLTALASKPPADLPKPVAEAIRNLIAQLPQAGRLGDPQGLQQALRNSGLFLEAKLAQHAGQGAATLPPQLLGADLKNNLLQLVQALRAHLPQASAATTAAATAEGVADELARTLPPLKGSPLQAQPRSGATLGPQSGLLELGHELGRQTQGALARLQVAQLSSVRTEPESGNQWLLELPVRNGTQQVDLIELRIEEPSAGRRAGGEESWSVNLALDLGELGAVQARVTLSGADQIGVMFWAEQERADLLIREHLPTLHANLGQAGLTVRGLASRVGEPPPPAREAELNFTILDERA